VPLAKSGRRVLVGLCPFHGEKTPSLSVYEDHWHCFGCGAHGDAISWVMRVRRMSFPQALAYLGVEPEGGRPAAAPPLQTPVAPVLSPTLDAARRCWGEAIDAKGTLVETYLNGRGLSLPSDAPVRFHPGCRRGGRDRTGCVSLWPAMLCLLTNPVTGKATGTHRTYLSPAKGKAPPITRDGVVLPSKAILGSWGSICIGGSSEALAISEGLENGLSAKQLLGWDGPVWAAGCQAAVASFPVLDRVTRLVIFADPDPVGIRAAQTCADRWRGAGRDVEIHTPPAGRDWNEELRTRIG
jgi:hypothetical protein